MKKLNSIADLKAAAKEYKPILDLRENHTDAIPDKRDILVCGGTGCTSSESLLIIEKLKEEIKKGNLKSGDKLPAEQEMAKIFNVSRSTIREALTILRVERVVETKKGVGTVIIGYDTNASKINENFFTYLVNKYSLKTDKKSLFEKALELVKIRKLLEPYIYEELAKDCPKELLKELKVCLKATRNRMKETMPYTVELTEFHYITYKYIKNDILKELLHICAK